LEVKKVSKAKVGLVAVASHAESGGERAEEILEKARERLENSGLEVKTGKKTIWDSADAIQVAEQLAQEGIDLLVIIHVTWVLDAIQYLLIKILKIPVVLWGIPFPETFSIGCVQHFGSILWERKIPYKYVYGLPEDEEVISSINNFARVAKVSLDLRKAKIALIGPRQTWRVAGPQDMTSEEWDLTDCFGVKIVHVDMEELIKLAEAKSDKEANNVLQSMRQNNRIGKTEVGEERLIYASRIYLGMKELIDRYSLTAAAAECYPQYGGLVNLPSSWLADENIILDTEGDLGHTTTMLILQWLGKGGPVALAEAGELDFKENCLWLSHEGSSAHSLAETISKVCITPGGEKGTVVGVPLKPMPQVTIASLCGKKGTYRMLIAKGKTEPITEKEWIDAGKKLLIKLSLNCDVKEAFESMLCQGIDHHLLIKEGDLTPQLADLCDLLGVEKVYL
jgi:L-fucose isomerase-like protein